MDELFSVTTALPTLGKVFNRADISTWVGTAYLLTSTVRLSAGLFIQIKEGLITRIGYATDIWQIERYLRTEVCPPRLACDLPYWISSVCCSASMSHLKLEALSTVCDGSDNVIVEHDSVDYFPSDSGTWRGRYLDAFHDHQYVALRILVFEDVLICPISI